MLDTILHYLGLVIGACAYISIIILVIWWVYKLKDL